MATLSVQAIQLSGTAVSYSAAAGGGDEFPNDGATKLHVKNGSGSSITVTIDSPNTCNFGLSANAAHDLTVTVPAGTDKFIGPFTADRFNDANGHVTFTYSAVTSVTVAAVK